MVAYSFTFNGRTLTALLFLTSTTFHIASGIECYRCAPKPMPTSNQTEKIEMCSQFDGSSKFRVDCPYSTFCMKRNFTLNFPDGTNAMVTERGCAHQVLTYKILVKGKWQIVNDVKEEIYQEGCHAENAGEVDKPSTLYCYCSGRLCNTSPKHFHINWLLWMGSLLTLIISKVII